jgi:hypothetical protein
VGRVKGRIRPRVHSGRLAVLATPVFFALIVFLVGTLPAAGSGFAWRDVPNKAFHLGESIVYVIKYGFVSAGTATLEITDLSPVNGRPAYHVVSRAKTNKTMDVVFKVRDRNESWMDLQSLCSLRFIQDLREGLYEKETRTEYDHPAGRFSYWKKRKGKEQVNEGGIPPFVQDVLSALYYIRTQDLVVGQDYLLDANSGGKTWPLKVHVQRVQKVKVPAGKFECYHLEPILAGEGIFQQQGRLEVWVTKDERKIPVLLRSRVMVGAFDAEMIEYTPGSAAKNVVGPARQEPPGEEK